MMPNEPRTDGPLFFILGGILQTFERMPQYRNLKIATKNETVSTQHTKELTHLVGSKIMDPTCRLVVHGLIDGDESPVNWKKKSSDKLDS